MKFFKQILSIFLVVACSWIGWMPSSYAGATCSGHFVNPITDICWDCLFPLSIGNVKVVHSSYPDTQNPSSPLCLCNMKVGWRVGVSFGYWEPDAMVDVTRKPFCMVNLGGIQLHVGALKHDIGSKASGSPGVDHGAFYWVHWYKYPLIYWLKILTNVGCMQKGSFDLAYLSELDPSWNDDQLGFVLDPEAILFGNKVAQLSCLADALKTTTGHQLPYDHLFWCMGAQGSTYPLDGNIANQTSPIQAATLLAERMDYKLHREGLIWDSVGKNSPALCTEHYDAIMPKSRYRYQMINSVPDAKTCSPFGTNTETWESGHEPVSDHSNFGFLIWQKRNCCLL
jgi:conjugal transfer pilus assembly protein TraU